MRIYPSQSADLKDCRRSQKSGFVFSFPFFLLSNLHLSMYFKLLKKMSSWFDYSFELLIQSFAWKLCKKKSMWVGFSQNFQIFAPKLPKQLRVMCLCDLPSIWFWEKNDSFCWLVKVFLFLASDESWQARSCCPGFLWDIVEQLMLG